MPPIKRLKLSGVLPRRSLCSVYQMPAGQHTGELCVNLLVNTWYSFNNALTMGLRDIHILDM